MSRQVALLLSLGALAAAAAVVSFATWILLRRGRAEPRRSSPADAETPGAGPGSIPD
jgi:hypothetical protein